MEQIEDILNEEPNFIQSLYGHNCFRYDNPQIYGENCKKAFEDDRLRMNIVSQVRMVMG